ncbi:Sodium/alanine transporter [Pseudomonas syringae pv. antirrhini]|uniref:Sodium/alanine transporter n=1 Tax=Pseudomonas syringae pv. antirrhini TaxID=251702 RepID=A0A0P9KUR4_9PSED|nr:Sodium/alanine transporter [Pseudomonas syringae pv. antirrhini]
MAFVNLIALAMLFKVVKRILNDYDAQRRAGIKTPVFDSSQFPDLDLDRSAWPANPSRQSTHDAELAGKPAPEAR